jgi:two-component system cell cycle response regulator DivK
MAHKLLHVDDDPRQTDLLRILLKTKDYIVISANDARTALAMIEKERPDICLMDINMPQTNGVELAAQIKANAAYRHIPLIALTANTMYGDREYYLANHFDGYLGKPMLRIELLQVLEAAFVKPVPPP